MLRNIYQKVRDGSGERFRKIGLSDSIIELFPAAVYNAAENITHPEAKSYREYLYSLGATPEGLINAIKFYERYFQQLLNREAKERALESFEAIDVPAGDISYLLFQCSVALSMLTTYHDGQVEYGNEESEWREGPMKDAVTLLSQFLSEQEENILTE